MASITSNFGISSSNNQSSLPVSFSNGTYHSTIVNPSMYPNRVPDGVQKRTLVIAHNKFLPEFNPSTSGTEFLVFLPNSTNLESALFLCTTAEVEVKEGLRQFLQVKQRIPLGANYENTVTYRKITSKFEFGLSTISLNNNTAFGSMNGYTLREANGLAPTNFSACSAITVEDLEGGQIPVAQQFGIPLTTPLRLFSPPAALDFTRVGSRFIDTSEKNLSQLFTYTSQDLPGCFPQQAFGVTRIFTTSASAVNDGGYNNQGFNPTLLGRIKIELNLEIVGTVLVPDLAAGFVVNFRAMLGGTEVVIQSVVAPSFFLGAGSTRVPLVMTAMLELEDIVTKVTVDFTGQPISGMTVSGSVLIYQFDFDFFERMTVIHFTERDPSVKLVANYMGSIEYYPSFDLQRSIGITPLVNPGPMAEYMAVKDQYDGLSNVLLATPLVEFGGSTMGDLPMVVGSASMRSFLEGAWGTMKKIYKGVKPGLITTLREMGPIGSATATLVDAYASSRTGESNEYEFEDGFASTVEPVFKDVEVSVGRHIPHKSRKPKTFKCFNCNLRYSQQTFTQRDNGWVDDFQCRCGKVLGGGMIKRFFADRTAQPQMEDGLASGKITKLTNNDISQYLDNPVLHLFAFAKRPTIPGPFTPSDVLSALVNYPMYASYNGFTAVALINGYGAREIPVDMEDGKAATLEAPMLNIFLSHAETTYADVIELLDNYDDKIPDDEEPREVPEFANFQNFWESAIVLNYKQRNEALVPTGGMEYLTSLYTGYLTSTHEKPFTRDLDYPHGTCPFAPKWWPLGLPRLAVPTSIYGILLMDNITYSNMQKIPIMFPRYRHSRLPEKVRLLMIYYFYFGSPRLKQIHYPIVRADDPREIYTDDHYLYLMRRARQLTEKKYPSKHIEGQVPLFLSIQEHFAYFVFKLHKDDIQGGKFPGILVTPNELEWYDDLRKTIKRTGYQVDPEAIPFRNCALITMFNSLFSRYFLPFMEDSMGNVHQNHQFRDVATIGMWNRLWMDLDLKHDCYFARRRTSFDFGYTGLEGPNSEVVPTVAMYEAHMLHGSIAPAQFPPQILEAYDAFNYGGEDFGGLHFDAMILGIFTHKHMGRLSSNRFLKAVWSLRSGCAKQSYEEFFHEKKFLGHYLEDNYMNNNYDLPFNPTFGFHHNRWDDSEARHMAQHRAAVNLYYYDPREFFEGQQSLETESEELEQYSHSEAQYLIDKYTDSKLLREANPFSVRDEDEEDEESLQAQNEETESEEEDDEGYGTMEDGKAADRGGISVVTFEDTPEEENSTGNDNPETKTANELKTIANNADVSSFSVPMGETSFADEIEITQDEVKNQDEDKDGGGEIRYESLKYADKGALNTNYLDGNKKYFDRHKAGKRVALHTGISYVKSGTLKPSFGKELTFQAATFPVVLVSKEAVPITVTMSMAPFERTHAWNLSEPEQKSRTVPVYTRIFAFNQDRQVCQIHVSGSVKVNGKDETIFDNDQITVLTELIRNTPIDCLPMARVTREQLEGGKWLPTGEPDQLALPFDIYFTFHGCFPPKKGIRIKETSWAAALCATLHTWTPPAFILYSGSAGVYNPVLGQVYNTIGDETSKANVLKIMQEVVKPEKISAVFGAFSLPKRLPCGEFCFTISGQKILPCVTMDQMLLAITKVCMAYDAARVETNVVIPGDMFNKDGAEINKYIIEAANTSLGGKQISQGLVSSINNFKAVIKKNYLQIEQETNPAIRDAMKKRSLKSVVLFTQSLAKVRTDGAKGSKGSAKGSDETMAAGIRNDKDGESRQFYGMDNIKRALIMFGDDANVVNAMNRKELSERVSHHNLKVANAIKRERDMKETKKKKESTKITVASFNDEG